MRNKSKTLVYNFGSEAGFFSEVNNMILAFLYCIKNDIEFVLFNSSASIGWDSFFYPFCKQTYSRYHSKFNYRQPYFVPRGGVYLLNSQLFKRVNRFDYYTYELWPFFHNHEFEHEFFCLPSLNDHCNDRIGLRDACNLVLKEIWKYNNQTSNEIRSIIASIGLPKEYVSIHIRRGDKSNEKKEIGISRYMEKVAKASCNDLFIATDDYSVVEYLFSAYPQYNYFSLTDRSKLGYSQSEFEQLDLDKKRKEVIILLATIEVLCNSKLMVGSFTSNVGMFCGMRLNNDKFMDVEDKDWMIW